MIAIIILCILVFFIYFYRKDAMNPDIHFTQPKGTIISPCYGKIMKINETNDYIEIITFLSPLDKHYQIYPCDAIVKSTFLDKTGKFAIANDCGKSSNNEKQITVLITKWGEITIKQIAGFLVRCIEFYNKPGDKVCIGSKLGNIRFGSRVDIIIPKFDMVGQKNNFRLMVYEGDRVNGHQTQLGIFV